MEPNSDNDPISFDPAHDRPSYAKLVGPFLEALVEQLNDMQKAVDAANFEVLRGAAQKLKGTGDGYGYPILTARAAALELHAAQRSFEECRKSIADLKEISARLIVSD